MSQFVESLKRLYKNGEIAIFKLNKLLKLLLTYIVPGFGK